MAMKDYRSVYHMVLDTVERAPEKFAYGWSGASGEIDKITWTEHLENLRRAGRGLIALGVEPGDKVSILSYSCYRWVLVDQATASIGSCTVGIYHSNLAEDCRYIVEHSDSVLVFAEDRIQLAKLLEIRDQIPRVKKVIMINGEGEPGDDWVISFEEFLALGESVTDEILDGRIEALNPELPAAIVYTSGTTGVPKGAVLTHDNVTFTSQSVFGCATFEDGDIQLLFLPLAHVFARTCVSVGVIAGSTTIFSRGFEQLAEDFRLVRPHWFASVPRVYEKVHAKIVSTAEATGGLKWKIFKWACDVGGRVSDCKVQKKPVPFATGLQYGLAQKLVFGKIAAALGGRVRWCISGAAPLNPALGRFFHSAGVLVLEGIGMTENTSFTNVNRPDDYRFGWVGPTGPGVEQKIGEDGEVLFRGRNVMKEYYKMPEETAETLTSDGWQHSGDLGDIDDEGFLRITGRKKDLIITAGGKNVAPSRIETLIALSKYIQQVCVVGDRRNFLSALVTLDPPTIEDFARDQGLTFDSYEDLQTRPEIQELVNREVEKANGELARFESIKKAAVVPEFTIENGMLTPTMKVKRNVVMEEYAELIEGLYSD